MGLIKAITRSGSQIMADQWREYFYCESMPETVLVTKGQKRVNGGSNTKGSDNIISNGSVIAINEGQCMMIVDQGGIVEFSAEPGEYTWESSSEASIFYGSLGESLKSTWETMKRRVSFGGDTGKDQRVYYFNLKEIRGNKYGTATPVPFRITDQNIGLDMDTAVRCNGEYSYKITNPMLFYKNVCGNVEKSYTRDQLDSTLKSEFLTALQPAFAEISGQGIRYSSLPAHTKELSLAMSKELSSQWDALRGISVVIVSMNSVTIPPEDEETIKKLQRTAVFRRADMAAANIADAHAEAMKTAAGNEGGSMLGFMGMGFANQVGSASYQAAAAQIPQQPQQPQQAQQPQAPQGAAKG